MKIVIYFLSVLFCLLQSTNSQEIEEFYIGYYDLEEDKRYDLWGVHPVDIRSQTNRVDRRPRAGALLGIEDIKPFQRMAKTKFHLITKRFTKQEKIKDKIKEHIKNNNINFIVLDLPGKMLLNIAKDLSSLNIPIMNVSAKENYLRSVDCINNLFHTIPSQRMLTDSIAQYLSDKKWRKVLVLVGPLKEDVELSESFIESARQFGLKITDKRYFLLSNDPRAREDNDIDFLTGSIKYDAVFVSDTDREFSYKLPYATQRPATVMGSSGLVARAWHWSYLRHGAPQLHGRFERMHNRRMNSNDWAAWIAIKSIAEAKVRFGKNNNFNFINAFINPEFILDGYKGPATSFRPWNRQLRQTIMLSTENWVTSIAPLESFVHSENNLDTIGIDKKNSKCKN